MSAPAWTKGPLRVSGKHAVIIEEVRESFPGYRPMVAEVFARSADGEALATGHLFAAAPDLYEALEEMASQNRCGCGHPACKNCQRDEMCDAALARARGEEHSHG